MSIWWDMFGFFIYFFFGLNKFQSSLSEIQINWIAEVMAYNNDIEAANHHTTTTTTEDIDLITTQHTTNNNNNQQQTVIEVV